MVARGLDQGVAEVVDGSDEAALRAFRSTWFLRTILKTEHHIVAEGGRICFIRIRPDPVVFTYGFGMSLLTMRRHAGKGARRVPIPAGRVDRTPIRRTGGAGLDAGDSTTEVGGRDRRR